jgi:transposase
MIFIGIDVSKNNFDTFCKPLGSNKFKNDEKGFALLAKWVLPLGEVCCVMEASGPYYLKLAAFLHEAGIKVSVVNPLVIRRFCQMNLQRTKTDKKDAISIADFAEMTKPKLWKPAPDSIRKLRELYSAVEQFNKQLRATENSIEAFNQLPDGEKIVFEAFQALRKVQIQQIKDLEKEIKSIVEKIYSTQKKSLESIPGIGPKTAALLIIITEGFTRFKDSKKLIAYVGLSPRIFQSGKTINKKPRISKQGMSEIRRLLYVCSLSAIRFNPYCKEFYLKLRSKGKPAKVALIAVANKLLRQAFSIVMNKTEFSLANSI